MGIANKGRELVDIPEDKKLFREETYGKVVIMGRKTLEALLTSQHLLEERILFLQEIKIMKLKTYVYAIVLKMCLRR